MGRPKVTTTPLTPCDTSGSVTHNLKVPHLEYLFPFFLYLFYSTVMTMEPSTSSPKKKPMVIITIGMAGAGKSTFVQRINSYLHSLSPPSPPYILNLDPAVTHLPFEANIDIRDTVNYQEVMKQCVAVSLLLVTSLEF